MGRRVHCGINIDPTNKYGRPLIQQIKDLGATWVRFVFKDYSAGPLPSQFSFYDPVVQELNRAGIKVLLILNYETYPGKPTYDADDVAWNVYIAGFVRRCHQIAMHYEGEIQAYQIWNEPDALDISPNYDPRLRPQVFAHMLKGAFAAIRRVSRAKVVTGGLVSGQPGYLEQVKRATGGVLHSDAVGVHPYGRRPTAEWPRSDWGFGLIGDLIREYHHIADQPIWITEIGTDDVSVQDRFPRYALQSINEMATLAPYVFWFCWSDGMVYPFGVVDAAGRKKGAYASFREFATLPLEESEVIDWPCVHFSSRHGQSVRYIIVHSTGSPVGSPAENTLRYLAGPNERDVSAHELVLPGPKVYRLAPDEMAAHHCQSETVSFPDGTPAYLANEITWGIQAYQVVGRTVGEEVLSATVERVAAACRRLGLDPSRVLGHKEIDLARRDPVGVDMEEFRARVARALLGETLLAQAQAHQVIRFNPGAALQKHIFADGFVPNSPEFDVQIGGITYRAQQAEHLATGKVRVYYAKVGDWGNVRFVERG